MIVVPPRRNRSLLSHSLLDGERSDSWSYFCNVMGSVLKDSLCDGYISVEWGLDYNDF